LITRYFHGISSGRHRKEWIQSLVQDEGLMAMLSAQILLRIIIRGYLVH
jgi:hypothetical protein